MLKRSIAAIQHWLSPKRTTQDTPPVPSDLACATRRTFFKRAAVGAATITGTAGLAKVVVDSVPKPDLGDRYRKEGLAGEQELTKREYVLMSDQEKAVMVQTLIENSSGRI